MEPACIWRRKELLYDLGGLMQVSNDILISTKEDKEAGIRTLATTVLSYRTTAGLVHQELIKRSAVRLQLPAHPSHGRRFLSLLSAWAYSAGVRLPDQLESLERSGGTFMLREYSRQDSICDMDTWANKWVSGRYFRS